MAKSTRTLRALAAQALARARDTTDTGTACELRDYARELRQVARKRDLAQHTLTVGRANVTADSYRAYLRGTAT